MRTVLYGICLFIDNPSKYGHHIYMERKEGERELDNGETEREFERWCAAERGSSVGCKKWQLEKTE